MRYYIHQGLVASYVKLLMQSKEEIENMKHYVTCQCCGKKYSTRRFGTTLCTICPNCDWEQDDVTVSNEESFANNGLTIVTARNNIIATGNIYGEKRKWYQRKAKPYFLKF